MNWYKKSKPEDLLIFAQVKNDLDEDKWVDVDSSFISKAAYYEPLGMFEMKMKNGKEYSFAGVPKQVYDDFLASPSKGTFFNKVIKERYKMQ